MYKREKQKKIRNKSKDNPRLASTNNKSDCGEVAHAMCKNPEHAIFVKRSRKVNVIELRK